MNHLDRRSAQVQHEQGHRYSEHAVAQSREALDAVAGDPVISYGQAFLDIMPNESL